MKRRIVALMIVTGLINSSLFAFAATAAKPVSNFYIICLQNDVTGGGIDSPFDEMVLSAFNIPNGVSRVEFYPKDANGYESFAQANRKSGWQFFGSAYLYKNATSSYSKIETVYAWAWTPNGTPKAVSTEVTCTY